MKSLVRPLLAGCLIHFALHAAPAPASYQFDAARLARLRELIAREPSAAALFKTVKAQADLALTLQPHPIAVIRTEGLLKGDPAKSATKKSLQDVRHTEALAHAWLVTGDDRYLAKAREYLLAWARVNHPSSHAVDDTNLEPMIQTYELIQRTLSPADNALLRQWILALGAEAAKPRKDSDNRYGNWNSHRAKIIGLAGFALNDPQLIATAKTEFENQIQHNLKPDGGSYDLDRRDSLHYHCYTLEPLLALCAAAHQHQLDWFNYATPDGRSLRRSVAFLQPYLDGSQTHKEWLGSKVDFDKKRADNGEKQFQPGQLWDPREGLKVLNLYYYFDPAVLPLIQRLEKKSVPYPNWPALLACVEAGR